MHDILDKSSGNVIGIRVSSTLQEEEYDAMTALLKKRIDAYGDIHLLFEMRDFEGWTPSALWKDIKFDVSYNQQVTRIAILGDKDWEKWMTQLAKPFAHAKVRYFNPSERDEAWSWIRKNAIPMEG